MDLPQVSLMTLGQVYQEMYLGHLNPNRVPY